MVHTVIRAKLFHDLKAGHNRHVQVKQKHRQIIHMPVDLFHCLSTVLRFDDLVFLLLQNRTQSVPVELLIIYDQNQFRTYNLISHYQSGILSSHQITAIIDTVISGIQTQQSVRLLSSCRMDPFIQIRVKPVRVDRF